MACKVTSLFGRLFSRRGPSTPATNTELSEKAELQKERVDTASTAATKGTGPKKPKYLIQIKEVWDLTYESEGSEATGGQWVLGNVPRAEWPRPVKLPKGTVVRRFPDSTATPKAVEFTSWYQSPTGLSAHPAPPGHGAGTTKPLDYDNDDKASVASTLKA